MQLKRVLKHLWVSELTVRRLFPVALLNSISQTIAECEKLHNGEIRFAVENALDFFSLVRGLQARERALQVFSEMHIWDTEANNGVLIYLLLADNDVEIVADRGINSKVSPEEWENICKNMEESFRKKQFIDGVLSGIKEVSSLLQKYYPGTSDMNNELPDEPLIL
ncbi:MAG: hypothetical protein GX556_00330 [Fibrobacter sp.]|nr:hypothetical protein [Fibrobacter sp.]